MSALEEEILEEIRDLPAERQQEVLEFARKLKQPQKGKRLKIFEEIDEIVNAVPLEAWAELPADGAANVDHYLYGTPKRK